MTSADHQQSLHSGIRLQKLRELQGIELTVVASDISVAYPLLLQWERTGVPEENIETFCHYFEVSKRYFTAKLTTDLALEALARQHFFNQSIDTFDALIAENRRTKSTTLDLSGLGLREIPSSVFGLTWLTALNLSDNKLNHIPSHLLSLEALTTLDIRDNFIQHIPAMVLSFKHLQDLFYAGNPLSQQFDLVHSDGSLEQYRAYIAPQDVTIIIGYPLNAERLAQLNDLQLRLADDLLLIMDSLANAVAAIEDQPLRVTGLIVFVASIDVQSELLALEPALVFSRKSRIPLLVVGVKSTDDIEQQFIEQFNTLLLESSVLVKFCDSLDQLVVEHHAVRKRQAFARQIPTVRFERLILDNIGVYERLDIEFRHRSTVLVGLNGAGKTTILKALALATLGPDETDASEEMAGALLRIVGKQAQQTIWHIKGSITLVATVNGKSCQNQITLGYDSKTGRVKIKGTKFEALFDADNQLRTLILGISEQRNVIENKALYFNPPNPDELDLRPIIDGQAANCSRHFNDWIGNLAVRDDTVAKQIISATFAIFSALMKEPIRFAGITQVKPLALWVEHQQPSQLVPLRLVSQGYQAVMGWVGFIVKRMFEAYQGACDPFHQPAIILIDEIDQLLHVKWQQDILTILADRFFPNTQWIVTTHSPIVVAGLEQDQVIQLHQQEDKMVAEYNAVDLWLWQYGDVIQHLFNVTLPSPKVTEQQLLANITELEGQATQQLTQAQQRQLEKWQVQLGKVQASRAFVDAVYAEQQKLKAREQELLNLIETLKSKT